MDHQTTIPQRIAIIKGELGIIEDIEFGKLAGMSKSVVHQLITGQIKSINPVYAYKLEDTTGYSAKWIMLGEGPRKTTAFDTNTRAAKLYMAAQELPAYEVDMLLKFCNTLSELNTHTQPAIAGFFFAFQKKYRTLDLIKFSGLYFTHAAKQRGKFGKPEQSHLHQRPKQFAQV